MGSPCPNIDHLSIKLEIVDWYLIAMTRARILLAFVLSISRQVDSELVGVLFHR
jgi:hypothetical protein